MVNQYSLDFKLKIVKMILNENISKHQIERTYSVARKTQREWVRKYQAEGISGLVSKRKIKDQIPSNQEPESVESLKHEILMKLDGLYHSIQHIKHLEKWEFTLERVEKHLEDQKEYRISFLI